MRFEWMLTIVLSFACAGACGVTDPGLDVTGTTSTTTVVTSTTGSSAVEGTSGSTGSSPTSSAGTTASEVSGTDGGMLIEQNDIINDCFCCSVFEQDCQEGHKCSPYSNKGDNSWNSTTCVPLIGGLQAGEPCFAEGGAYTGYDDCHEGLMCWEVGPDNMGTCVPQCSGTPEMPVCPTGTACALFTEVPFGVCLDGCDPLIQDCPSVESVCIATVAEDGFLCVFKNPEESGQVHDPCVYANDCDAGLVCGEPSAAVECNQDVSGCCEPYCDLEAANTCPGQGQECVPFFAMGMAPTGYENVGRCSVPL